MLCTCQVGFCLRDVSDLATPGLYRRASLVETFKESILNPLYCTFIGSSDASASTTKAVDASEEIPAEEVKTANKRRKRKPIKN